ncbi:hypothetical protein KCU73_g12984, partial [Aureobasidium melanogenum]
MADRNKTPELKTPGNQQSGESNGKETKPADGEHVKDQANGHHSTTTTTRPVNLSLRTTTTKLVAPSLLSPFSPSNAELVGHNHVTSQMPAAPIARGPEFEHRAARAMETTMHLAQIVRTSKMAVANEEKGSDEATVVVEGKAEEGDGTEERQQVEDKEEGEKEKGEINSENVFECHKSMMFKRCLETLDKEYWDDSNDIVDAWMDRHFQLGDDAVAGT